MRADGKSYSAIAELLGVNATAVRRVCDPEVRKRLDANTRAWMEKNKRQPCKGGCGRRVWMVNKERSGYCADCLRTKRLAERIDTRDGELLCLKCGEWKPDDEFPPESSSRRSPLRRRGKRTWCRPCCSAARRDHRQRNPVMQRNADITSALKKGVARMQSYVVLAPSKTEEHTWVEVTRLEAASPHHAVEQAATQEGTYVAVLESRFQAFPVKSMRAFKVVTDGT